MSEGSLPVRKEAWSGGDNVIARSVARPMVRFLAQEAASGLLLILATAVALIWVNSPFGDTYHQFWESSLGVVFDGAELFSIDGHTFTLEAWVNDGLMVLFFFVVGLEIKTELVVGDLRDPKVAALPAIAALGGMIVPALLYLVFNLGGDGASGWGIPMATDIAFAVGVLTLLGPKVPQKLKLFLLTLAIADDIGAILVIAAFYTAELSFAWLGLAIGGLALVFALQRSRVWYTPVYIIIGIGVWYAMLRSGVHATIAGVALGLLTPARPLLGERRFENVEDILSGDTTSDEALRDANWRIRESVSVCSRMIRVLSPWTSFLVVPLFALANAGVIVSASGLSEAVTSPVALGIVFGLVLGKPIGVTLFTLGATSLGLGQLPEGVSKRHIVGGGAVAGIGFTVALFVSGLAFAGSPELKDQATMGILAASLLATIVGWLILRSAPDQPESGE